MGYWGGGEESAEGEVTLNFFLRLMRTRSIKVVHMESFTTPHSQKIRINKHINLVHISRHMYRISSTCFHFFFDFFGFPDVDFLFFSAPGEEMPLIVANSDSVYGGFVFIEGSDERAFWFEVFQGVGRHENCRSICQFDGLFF